MSVKEFHDIAEKVILKALSNNHDKLLAYKLSKSWKKIVGSHISKMLKIKEVISDDCLVLKLTNHCYGTEVHMYKQLILDRINTYLGEVAILQLIII